MPRSLRVLISAGPTREPIDPIRFLSNHSTGYMGFCLASEALRRGHHVTMVCGPGCLKPPKPVQIVSVEQARHMRRALQERLPKADVLIMAAAVCDFRPARVSRRKLPRRGMLQLTLRATPDIVGSLPRRAGQLVVGFALETSGVLRRAQSKLAAKRLDLVVGQRVGQSGPFGDRPVRALLLDASGSVDRLGSMSKPRLARAILDKIESLWYGGLPAGRRFPRLRSYSRTARPSRARHV